MLIACLSQLSFAGSSAIQQTKGDFEDKFRQLDEVLPTPNVYRNAAGAPGHKYWQQKVDYLIDVTLDEANRRLEASQTVTYTNNSPDTLTYLWVQLDQNKFKSDSMSTLTTTFGGIKSTTFQIDFAFNIVEEDAVSARAGYEHFPDDEREGGNDIFLLAQWFPRLAAYTDYEAWTNKEFIGRGEFTLEFGDYEVNITVPADHIVSSTGELGNPRNVLTSEQRRRLRQAETAERPVFIVTEEEALENEKEGSNKTKTWQ